MTRTYSKVATGFQIAGEKAIYATETQAKRRLRDLAKKEASVSANAEKIDATYTAPAGSNSPATASAKELARNLAGALKTAREAAPVAKKVKLRDPGKIGKAILMTAAAKTAVKKSAKPAAPKAAEKPAAKPTASGSAAHPPKYDQPLASYSAYAQHRILLEKFGTDAAGQEKVLAHGTKVLGLPESQVKTYIREKINAIARDEQKKTGLHPSKPQLAKAARGEYEPDFRFKTRDAAKAHILATVRRNKMNEACYHILQEAGMFAVVGAHIKPAGKPAPLKTGDIVMDTTIADSRAEVIDGGPEQSTIRYLTERHYAPKECNVSNYYLHKVGTKASMKAELEALGEASAKRKAEKPAAPEIKKAVAKLADEGKIAKQPAAKKAAKKAKK